MFQAAEHVGAAGGQFLDELARVPDDGREREKDEEGNGATYAEQDDGDGGGAARTPLADPDALDTAEDGHEHNGKERADVEQRDLVLELIGNGQPDAQREGE